MIKIYKENYDREEFYSIMGKFFAEPGYQKDLPYLTNRENTIWYVKTHENSVAAFAAVEVSKSRIEFRTDYYIENIDDLVEIIKLKIEDYKSLNLPFYTATANEHIKNIFLECGFVIYKTTANYTFLRTEAENE